MKNLVLDRFGVQEMDATEIISINGGGQQTPAWLINSDYTAEAGSALRYAAGYVDGFLENVF